MRGYHRVRWARGVLTPSPRVTDSLTLFSLVVRPLFCFVVCWHSVPFQDKYVSGDSVNFRGSDSWRLCWGRLDLLLVRTQRVDPSACVFIIGCFYCFAYFTCLHCILCALLLFCIIFWTVWISVCWVGVSRGKRPNTKAMCAP